MKIPPDVWSYAWSLLGEQFDTPSDPVLDVYRRHVEAHLESVEEFERAVYVVLTTERFLPPPHAFVEAVRSGEVERDALEAWKIVRSDLSRPEEVRAKLGPTGRDALASIGGVTGVGQTPTSELRHVRREFLEAYRAYAPSVQERAALPLTAGSLELLPERGTHVEP